MEAKLNTVMLVDDDHLTNFLHERVLISTGVASKIEIAETAIEALDLLKEKNDSGNPELIFLDLNMPGLTGWDFIDEYKTLNGRDKRKSKIIILTASVNPDDEEKANSINEVTGFLSKPLTKSKVNEIIKKYFD